MKKYSSESEYNDIQQKLQDRADKGEKLTSEEIEEFCTCRKIDVIKKYIYCDDERFRVLFLRHFQGEILLPRHLEQLNQLAKDWRKNVVENPAPTDGLKQHIKNETLRELAQVKQELVGKYGYLRGGQKYKKKEKETIYMSKFIHIKGLAFFEKNKAPSKEIYFPINGVNLLFNDFSFAHIVFRHYAKLQKQFEADKSFFSAEVPIEKMAHILATIISKIEGSGFYVNDSIQSINFKYKNKVYRIGCKPKPIIKQVSGGNKIFLYRINTFHPLTESSDLSNLALNYNLIPIYNDLSIYVRK